MVFWFILAGSTLFLSLFSRRSSFWRDNKLIKRPMLITRIWRGIVDDGEFNSETEPLDTGAPGPHTNQTRLFLVEEQVKTLGLRIDTYLKALDEHLTSCEVPQSKPIETKDRFKAILE